MSDPNPPTQSTPPASAGEQNPLPHPEVPAWVHRLNDSGSRRDERMRAFIGPKWEEPYRRKLSPFFDDPSFVPTWNWSAFLATPLWFLYRKLYFAFIVFMFAPGIALSIVLGPEARLPITADPTDPEVIRTAITVFSFTLSGMIAAGGTGNWLLFRRARVVTQFAESQNLPENQALELISNFGGVHRGLTAVMAVISITPLLMRACAVGV